jgi:polysaccharide export outer membrane protein
MKLSKLVILINLLIFIYSCKQQKNTIYFQGAMNSNSQSTYSPTLKKDDLLSISVVGLDESVMKPFNLPTSTNYQNIGGYVQGAPTVAGYLISSEGSIDFPVLGKVKVAGLTRNDAIDTLKKLLIPYLTNPTIIMRIINYKVTVLGEVKNPGTFTIPNERITVLEAIGIAGDLLITGVRRNVRVIRDVDGKKQETLIDLTKKDLFNSPVYYLQQNDVVYVEPNRAKINSAVINPSNVSLIISIVSLFITIAILIKK